MCLNCDCGMYDDTMGDDDNIIMNTLAKAAIVGNDANAKDFLEKMLKHLQRVRPEDLQKKIDELKSKKEESK